MNNRNAKHTPGPWTAVERVEGLSGPGIHSANGGYVYVATCHLRANGDPMANARLIAACPDMFEVLVKLQSLQEQDSVGHDLLADIDAVIAKATGGVS